MEKWRCTICGYIHEGPMADDFKCPICKQPASVFEKVEEAATSANPYAGTKTEKNLMEAFAGESQARNKYTYFAAVAQREGYEQLAEIFLSTARNEQEHARVWFQELGHIGTTAENLVAAAAGENYESARKMDMVTNRKISRFSDSALQCNVGEASQKLLCG